MVVFLSGVQGLWFHGRLSGFLGCLPFLLRLRLLLESLWSRLFLLIVQALLLRRCTGLGASFLPDWSCFYRFAPISQLPALDRFPLVRYCLFLVRFPFSGTDRLNANE